MIERRAIVLRLESWSLVATVGCSEDSPDGRWAKIFRFRVVLLLEGSTLVQNRVALGSSCGIGVGYLLCLELGLSAQKLHLLVNRCDTTLSESLKLPPLVRIVSQVSNVLVVLLSVSHRLTLWILHVLWPQESRDRCLRQRGFMGAGGILEIDGSPYSSVGLGTISMCLLDVGLELLGLLQPSRPRWSQRLSAASLLSPAPGLSLLQLQTFELLLHLLSVLLFLFLLQILPYNDHSSSALQRPLPLFLFLRQSLPLHFLLHLSLYLLSVLVVVVLLLQLLHEHSQVSFMGTLPDGRLVKGLVRVLALDSPLFRDLLGLPRDST